MIFGWPGNNQGGARLVNQNRIDFIHNRIGQAALYPVGGVIHHVVAQIVKTEFIICTVGNISCVRSLFLLMRHLRQIDADTQAEKAIKRPHPLGITAGQIVVHGHDMHPLARKCIQINWQGGGQGLAFTGTHFSNLALMQGNTTDQLNVKMAHAHDTFRSLANCSECLGQKLIQRCALAQAQPEFIGLGA